MLKLTVSHTVAQSSSLSNLYVITDSPLVLQSRDSSGNAVSCMVSITYDRGHFCFSNFEGFNIFRGTVNFRVICPGVIQLYNRF